MLSTTSLFTGALESSVDGVALSWLVAGVVGGIVFLALRNLGGTAGNAPALAEAGVTGTTAGSGRLRSGEAAGYLSRRAPGPAVDHREAWLTYTSSLAACSRRATSEARSRSSSVTTAGGRSEAGTGRLLGLSGR